MEIPSFCAISTNATSIQEDYMLYHSTRSDLNSIDSAQAVLEGLAPDGGLYMPTELPAFDWKKCLEGSSMDMYFP